MTDPREFNRLADVLETQVDPEHTVSHAAKWAKTLFGVKNPPHWLRSESADRTIRHAAFALVAICLFLWAGKYFNVLSMSLGQKVLFFAGCTAVIGSIGWSLLLPLKSDGQVDTPASKVAVPNNAASMMSRRQRRSQNIWIGTTPMTADTSAPSLREALERIHARAIADDDADEKELRRQLYHIEALVKDAMTKLALLPDAATIRAAAFEEAAKIAEDDERQDEWPKSVDVTRTSPSRIMQQTIAAALRDAGRTG